MFQPQLSVTAPPTPEEEIVRYYEEVGEDYAAWSPRFNMHFGYWRPWLNPLVREPMLEEASLQVFSLLFPDESKEESVLDLGCGLGASMRCGARRYPQKQFKGITLVERQVLDARRLALREGLGARLSFMAGDFHQLPFPEGSFDCCYAMEAAAHGLGNDKRLLLNEVQRVLTPGGRVVFYDCFLKRPPQKMHRLVQRCYGLVCEGWAVPEFAELSLFTTALEQSGYTAIAVREVSWNVAPSVAHAPFVVASFLLSKLRNGERLSERRKTHLRSCLLACVLGIARNSFGYFLISAQKPDSR